MVLALCIAATGCAQERTSKPPPPVDRWEIKLDQAASERAASQPATPDEPRARPHDFDAVHLFSTKTDGTMRPDFVMIRVRPGGPHGDESAPQPVLFTQFVAAAEEGTTTLRAEGGVVTFAPGSPATSAVVGDRIAIATIVHMFDLPRVDWPAGHEDYEPPAPPTLAFASDVGRPTAYRVVYAVDRAGPDAVDLTFHFDARAGSVVVREIPETTVRVRYGQVAVFPTRRPPSSRADK